MLATWVTIHHEGAGAPTDRVSRFLSTDKYSAGIGITRYELWRDPGESFITTGQRGHCLQICLSGNRQVHATTDTDIVLIGNCCNEAKVKGWLIDRPAVYHHGDNGKTACPGTNTNNRRSEIKAACQTPIPVTSPLPPVPPTGVQLKGRRELMLIEQPGRTVDPVRLACLELRPNDHQIIAWNGASVNGDALLKAGDARRRGECRFLDLKQFTSNNIVGWKEVDDGCVFVTDGDGGTFHIQFS